MSQGDFVIRQSLHWFHIHFIPKGTAVAKVMKHSMRILDHTPHKCSTFQKASTLKTFMVMRELFFTAEKLVSAKERNTDVFFFPKMLKIYMRWNAWFATRQAKPSHSERTKIFCVFLSYVGRLTNRKDQENCHLLMCVYKQCDDAPVLK